MLYAFFIRNLQMGQISLSVCPWQTLPLKTLPYNLAPEWISTEVGSGLAHEHWDGLERPTGDKHFSLFSPR